MILASHRHAAQLLGAGTSVPRETGGWLRWPRFKTRWHKAKTATVRQQATPVAQPTEPVDTSAVPAAQTDYRGPIISMPATSQQSVAPFSLSAMLASAAASAADSGPEADAGSPAADSDNDRPGCRRRRLRFLHWRKRSSKPPRAERLPRHLRRVAKRLQLDAQQRQQLVELVGQLRALRGEFVQRGNAETQQWMDLLSSERFDSEAAMQLMRGHGRWWEEKLAELIMQYAALHDSLQAEQRERLIQGLSRMLQPKRRRF